MIYQFVDEATGEPVELNLPMGSAPCIGETTRQGGRVLRRVVTAPRIAVDKGCVSWQVERWHPDVKQHTKDGLAVFPNREAAKEFIRKNNGDARSDQDWHYDD